jgi:hypothetical protein
MEVPEGKEREKGTKRIFEEIMAEKSPTSDERQNHKTPCEK